MGYSLYERERNVRSEDYESKIIPVSFLPRPIGLIRNGRKLIHLALSLLSRMRLRRLLGWLISTIFRTMN